MTRLEWGLPGERYYETGVDRGVLYVDGYAGVPWNGLKAVTESPDGGDPRPFYVDGFKYANVAAAEEFAAKIEAYSAPWLLNLCTGMAAISNGLYATQQRRKPFGFTYRTLIGNDQFAEQSGYKIHLVYNALAAAGDTQFATLSNSADPSVLSWDISTRPEIITGVRPTAHLVIDSRTTGYAILAEIEDLLYGTGSADPTLPAPADILNIYETTPTGYGYGPYGESFYGVG